MTVIGYAPDLPFFVDTKSGKTLPGFTGAQ